MRKIEIESQAAKALARIPANIGELIENKIEQLASDPESLRNNITRLVGTKDSRLRIGDWRVIFRSDARVLRIVRIGPRGSAYD